MTDPRPVPVFDGHNDALLRLLGSKAADPAKLFIDGAEKGHVDLPNARKGGFGGGIGRNERRRFYCVDA